MLSIRLTFSLLAMNSPRVPAYRAIADSIREDIRSRRLLPGDRLPSEAEMAERFGVSRPTVREALRVVASQHLVETTRGATGGTFVVVPDSQNLVLSLSLGIELLASGSDLTVTQLLEARELLEIPAARLATERATSDDLDLIGLSLDPATSGGGVELMSNWTFHSLVVRAANNPLLELMAEPIFGVLQSRFSSNRASTQHRDQVDQDHRAIADAINAGDDDGAAEAMQSHLTYLRPVYDLFLTDPR